MASAVPTAGATSAVAVVGVTGAAMGLGVLGIADESAARSPAVDAGATLSGTELAGLLAARGRASDDDVSRSLSRPAALSEQRETKTAHLPVSKQEMSGQLTTTVEATEPRDIAITMMAEYGWGMDEFSCLDSLYVSESDWDHTATNPSSGAYGIPQALPAEKMASAGSDWRTNPATQIEWGLDYIRSSYGTPCSAWSFKSANNWY
jgi:hypothetical protein